MGAVTEWIRRHQVVAFFAITFTITWGLGFSYNAVMNRDLVLLAPLAFVATCGPALAGIIISAVCNTEDKSGKARAAWIAFFLAWVVVTVVFLAHNTLINQAPLSIAMVGFVLVSVVPVAFVISAGFSRVPSVRRFLVSLVHPRRVMGWSLLALVLVPGLALLSIPISNVVGRQPIAAQPFPASGSSLIGLIAVKFVYQFFFFNCTGEEVGWRGFALPRLQARTSPLIASLIVALFWAPWHLFLWHAEGQPVFTGDFWIGSFINVIPASVIIGWLYNRSRGSILVAGIAHASANTAFAFLPNLDWQVFNMTAAAAAAVMVMADRMWRNLPREDPAVLASSSPPVREDEALSAEPA